MIGFWQRLRVALGPFTPPEPRGFTAAICPDAPFVVIGDVHGRFDLLNDLLSRLPDQISPDTPLILVGDYIDRGEESAGVLKHLFNLVQATDRRVICLRGNHEDMLLSFLDQPELHGPGWLRHGGLQTLASFHISGVTPTRDADRLRHWRDALRDKMGPDLVAWLRGLPLIWSSGNVHVVHAAADPLLPMGQQSDKVLMWGQPTPNAPRTDGQWVVRGHVIVPELCVENGLISVDTGAYATGQLTAALISREGVRVI